MAKNKLFAFVASISFVCSSFAADLAEKDTDKDGKLSIEEFAGDDKKLKKNFKSDKNLNYNLIK